MQYPPPAVVLLALSVVALASCVQHAHPHPAVASVAFAAPSANESASLTPSALTPSHPTDARIVLVTLDGVRAQDVFDGADPSLRPDVDVQRWRRPEDVMPRLHRLVATRGVALGKDQPGCGAVRTASGMNVSLPGYREIFAGRKTRCRDNQCARIDQATILDEAADAELGPVASVGSWDLLDRAVSRGNSNVFVAEGAQRWPGPRPIFAGAMEPLVEAGEQTEAYPGSGHYRPDALTASIALEYLRTAAPRVFHVGLGDADEWGHRNDYAAYLEAIGKSDAFIGRLADMLDARGDEGARTTVIVTTDHGRNETFQHHGAFSATSARTFVIAFGGRVPVQGVACAKRDVSLADIAPTMRALLGLPRDTSLEAGLPIAELLPAPAAASDHLVAGVPDGGEAGGTGGGASAAGMLHRP